MPILIKGRGVRRLQRKKQNFIQGAFILMLASLLVKVIGAFFQIPLLNMIGGKDSPAFGMFSAAYRVYTAMLMISTVGPTFVINGRGERRGIDWGFNAWGGDVDGLYPSWEKDNRVARKFCDLLNNDVYDKRDFICEGGSIHSDGEGTVLVTEACLLSAGRNPDLTKTQIEQVLCDYLGVSKVIWLPRGIYNDETNEHVDNVCAFTAPGEVVLAWTDDETDPQYALSKASLDALEAATDAKGRKIKVHKLPLPKPVTITAEECDGLDLCDGEPTRTPGERLAASYVNFYIANEAVVMPAFGDPMDEKAQAILQELFPTRKVVAIAARDILIGGGNIHCVTQQIPKI